MARVTAFLEDKAIARGEVAEVTRALKERYGTADQAPVRAYEDETGRVVDLDYRDSVAATLARGRGRPRLGVVAREITLLPRHWEWLGRQRGGASAAVRRLVDEAVKAKPDASARRDSAYHFMADRCGDREGYEEALRALYRGDRERFEALIAEWPPDVGAYILGLLDGAAS